MFLWVELGADSNSEIKKGVSGGQGLKIEKRSKNGTKMGILL